MIRTDIRDQARLFTAGTYVELRAQENRSTNIWVLKGNVVANAREATAGVSAQAYDSGGWGFASLPDLSPDSMASVVAEATANAAFLGAKGLREPVALPHTCAEADNDLTTARPRLDQASLLTFIRELDELIAAKYPALTSRTVGVSCLDMEKTVLTSHGSHFHSMTPRTVVGIHLNAEKGGEPFEAGDGGGARASSRMSSPIPPYSYPA